MDTAGGMDWQAKRLEEKVFTVRFIDSAGQIHLQETCNRIIRRTLGKSAKEYIMDVVFEEACRRLRFTDTSVEEVSETLGFETSTYFIRSFGKRYGVTPLQYHKSNKE